MFFFPIISLFVLGNILFILNFFLPLKSTISFFLLFQYYFFFINILDLKRVILNVENIINHLIIPALLSISTYGINFHGDAGMYHLNAQLWLREEPIVFGISNITWAYGFQSIFEYISSIFGLKIILFFYIL